MAAKKKELYLIRNAFRSLLALVYSGLLFVSLSLVAFSLSSEYNNLPKGFNSPFFLWLECVCAVKQYMPICYTLNFIMNAASSKNETVMSCAHSFRHRMNVFNKSFIKRSLLNADNIDIMYSILHNLNFNFKFSSIKNSTLYSSLINH